MYYGPAKSHGFSDLIFGWRSTECHELQQPRANSMACA